MLYIVDVAVAVPAMATVAVAAMASVAVAAVVAAVAAAHPECRPAH